MTNKEITPKSEAHLPQGWQATSDDIDLRELVLVLWRHKGLILLMYLFTRTGLTASVLPGWDNLSSRCTP
ncbi:hypothetical protein ACET6V_15340 [Aeromonas caviae]|uniref:hypothetical protein n=1 Tax=Aeromonas caviae TaxID=648 RepID=UPI0038D1173B